MAVLFLIAIRIAPVIVDLNILKYVLYKNHDLVFDILMRIDPRWVLEVDFYVFFFCN